MWGKGAPRHFPLAGRGPYGGGAAGVGPAARLVSPRNGGHVSSERGQRDRADAAGSGPALSYARSGVDIEAAEATVSRYAELAARTRRPEVLADIGPFAGLFRLPGGLQDPVLVASTDSVGTKLLVAAAVGRYDTVGRDLVNHCVNDVLTAGAEPLFVLDYIATSDLAQDHRVELVAGVAAACEENGAALLGGETADLPGIYLPGAFDLVGTAVGVVEREAVVDGSRVGAGDQLLALPSSGLQTNGYSLVRRIWGIGEDAARDRTLLEAHDPELGCSLGDALLAVHGSFLEALRPLLGRPGGPLHGIAHITGGGVPGNLSRIVPDGLQARVDLASWRPPALFGLIRRQGELPREEMWRVFNMGVGLVLAVEAAEAEALLREVEGSWRLGEVAPRAQGEAPVVLVRPAAGG